MAKELPYFKFEPNQWENGNIQMYFQIKSENYCLINSLKAVH